MSWAESLGMDKPKQRKRSRCPVIPSPRLVSRRPEGAVCWDGVVGRKAHEWDRDGRCYWCSCKRRQ